MKTPYETIRDALEFLRFMPTGEYRGESALTALSQLQKEREEEKLERETLKKLLSEALLSASQMATAGVIIINEVKLLQKEREELVESLQIAIDHAPSEHIGWVNNASALMERLKG